MNASPSFAQALHPSAHLCPSWCTHEHLGLADDPCGFHHDGAVTAVGLAGPEDCGIGDYLFVNVSQREQCGELEQVFVEVQDATRTLALLTCDDCEHLAEALLEGARQIRAGRGA